MKRGLIAALTITLLLAQIFTAIAASPPSGVYSEVMEITHVYDKLIVISSLNTTLQLYDLPDNVFTGLRYLGFAIANFTPDTNLIKWFFDTYNPELRITKNIVFWRGVVLNVTYDPSINVEEALTRADKIAEWFNSYYHIGLRVLKGENNSFLYVSSGNYRELMNSIMDDIFRKEVDGFIEVPARLGVQYVAYSYTEGLESITALSVANINITRNDLFEHTTVDYMSILGEVKSSQKSTSSRLIVRLYGMMVDSSEVEGVRLGQWVSGMRYNWVTQNEGELPPATSIESLKLKIGLFRPLLMLIMTTSNAHPKANSTFLLEFKLKNLDKETARNITVEASLPEGIEPVSTTLINIDEVKGGEEVKRSIEVKNTLLNTTVIIPAPSCSYTAGETRIEILGNELAIAPGASSFASIIAYLRPLTNLTEVTGCLLYTSPSPRDRG